MFLQHLKPPQTTSHIMMITTRMAPPTISFIWRFWSHIFRRSCLPCRWKLSAWRNWALWNSLNHKFKNFYTWNVRLRKMLIPGTEGFLFYPPVVQSFPHDPTPTSTVIHQISPPIPVEKVRSLSSNKIYPLC